MRSDKRMQLSLFIDATFNMVSSRILHQLYTFLLRNMNPCIIGFMYFSSIFFYLKQIPFQPKSSYYAIVLSKFINKQKIKLEEVKIPFLIRISNLNLKIYLSMNLQKKPEEKFCNCRNSKCMKLYCECFAARVECGKGCHCLDCHNRNNAEHLKIYKDYNNSQRKIFKDQLARQHKGCACRKSGCTKKYCQCYQSGLLCRDICKCVECQNNESLSNKKVISELKRNSSNTSNKLPSLYPIILTQDNRHLNRIIADQNPLNIKDEWIQETAEDLYKKAQEGSVPIVIEKLLQILGSLQTEMISEKQQKMVMKQKIEMEEEDNQEQVKVKSEQSEQRIEQVDAQSPLSYKNLKEEQE